MLIDNKFKENEKRKLEICENTNMSLMQTDDYERAEFILQRVNIDSLPKQSIHQFTINDYTKAINLLKIYEDKKINNEIIKINQSASLINHNTDNLAFQTRIDFLDDINKGNVTRYTIPTYVNQLSDIFLAHEFNHALKDTNHQEFILHFVSGEVIPLFFELLALENREKNYKINFLQTRLYLISQSCPIYYEAKSRTNEDEKIFNLIKSDAGKYPNAFYLSLLLYNVYKKRPKQVLTAVKEVLLHKKTTSKILNEFGIYDIKYSNDVITRELDKIHNLIKNKKR